MKTRILEPTPEQVKATAEKFPVSFCIIATLEDYAMHYAKLMSTLPANAEITILINAPSTDGTESLTDVETIVDGTATIHHRKWTYLQPFHFAKARNLSHEMATNDWCMWLDMDDRLNPMQHGIIAEAATASPEGCAGITCVCTSMHSSSNGGTPEYSAVKQVRLYRKSVGVWEGRVHEQVWESCGRRGFTCGFSIVNVLHVGYSTDRKAILHKNLRNVYLLCHEIAERGLDDSALSKYYRTILRRDINSLEHYED